MKKIFILVLGALININVQAQTDTVTTFQTTAVTLEPVSDPQPTKKQSVYNINPWIDIPVTVATDAFSLYGMSVIYGRDDVSEAEILALDRNDVNKFDRSVIDNYDMNAKKASDYFFYGSMPLPLFLLFDKEIRKEGHKVGLLYLQAMGITGTLYTSSAMIADRFRPLAYNKNVDMATRTRGGSRNSFFAGHPAVVGTATFFMAKVYADYHPNMKHKWILYTAAGALTATTGLLRLQGGQHFRTDVITGCIIGPLVGVLVPHIHKNKALNNKLTLMPNIRQSGGGGFTAFYKLGK